jgi:CMP-N-acetylneuraminic acid synthetase
MTSPIPHGLAAGGHEFDIVIQLFPGPPQRSQDLSTLYGPTVAIWIARTAALLQAGTLYGPGHKFWEIDWRHGVDIDDAEDLDFAAALFSMKDRHGDTTG